MRVRWKVVSFLGITQGITRHRTKLREKMRATVFCFVFFFFKVLTWNSKCDIYHVSLNISSSKLFLMEKVLLVCGGAKNQLSPQPSIFF